MTTTTHTSQSAPYGICAHCGFPAHSSPCASCRQQDRPADRQPRHRPHRKEPPRIADAMGPLPAPPQQAQTQEPTITGTWCDGCDANTVEICCGRYIKAPGGGHWQVGMCVGCCDCGQRQEPSEAHPTRGHLGYKADALPESWRNFMPDMSGISYEVPRLTPATINHKGLTWAIRQGEVSFHSDHWRSVYSGRLHPNTQESILKYMRDHGATEKIPRFCRITNECMDLYVRCGVDTVVELRDFTRMIPTPPSAMLSINGDLGATAQIGGVA